jgi:hypothetical protein
MPRTSPRRTAAPPVGILLTRLDPHGGAAGPGRDLRTIDQADIYAWSGAAGHGSAPPTARWNLDDW